MNWITANFTGFFKNVLISEENVTITEKAECDGLTDGFVCEYVRTVCSKVPSLAMIRSFCQGFFGFFRLRLLRRALTDTQFGRGQKPWKLKNWYYTLVQFLFKA